MNELKTIQPNAVGVVGQNANQAARQYVFEDYHQRRSKKTIDTHRASLIAWMRYLEQVRAVSSIVSDANLWVQQKYSEAGQVELRKYAAKIGTPHPLIYAAIYAQHEPGAWVGTTWGLVEGFVKWLLNEGYSIATVNLRLTSIKVYCRLATKADVVTRDENLHIQDVRGYGRTEGKRVDERRIEKGQKTRSGHKKVDAIVLSREQVKKFKGDHEATPQGVRDRLLLCLFLDLGLRNSEVARLTVEDFAAEAGYVIVYRKKTDTIDRMELTADLLTAMAAYQPFMPDSGVLLRSSKLNKELANGRMKERAIGKRVRSLGRDILGIYELSPHDLRHTWATHMAKHNSPFLLRDAGGWSNMQTPSRYVERGKVVNEGAELDY